MLQVKRRECLDMSDAEDSKKMKEGQFYVYTLVGHPIPQMRPRFGGGRVWSAQSKQKFASQLELAEQHKERPLFDGPVHIDAVFYFTPAKSSSKKHKEKLIDTYHVSKPDIDNLLKYIMDSSSKILFNDDCIVASLRAIKKYSTVEKTVLTVTQLVRK